MIESLLQEATDALLAQQDEIRRLHRVLAWCRYRVEPDDSRRMDAMIRSSSSNFTAAARKFPRGAPADHRNPSARREQGVQSAARRS